MQVDPKDIRLETLADGKLHVLGSGASGVVRLITLHAFRICLDKSAIGLRLGL